MKDIDFDELDRAVSSALGVNVSDVAVPKPAAPDVPEVKTPTVGTPTTSEEPKAKTLVQKRSTGRFMDVVHPSAKLKHSKNSPSRQGVTIAAPVVNSSTTPASQEVASKSQAVSTAPPAAKSAPVKKAIEPAKATDREVSHSFPDPLDFHNFSVESEDRPNSTTQARQDSSNPFTVLMKDEPVATSNTEHEAAQDALDQAASELSELNGLVQADQDVPPLDTPFMQDLAVEKRPLGAFSLDDADRSLLSDDAKEYIDTVEQHTQEVTAGGYSNSSSEANSASVDEVPNKGALKSDTAAALGVNGVAEPAAPVALRESDAQVAAEAEVMPEELRQDVVAVEAREVTSAGGAGRLETGSITQQYKEVATAPSEEVTPIFDTASYHQPLAHTKKKSGWLSVIVIALLVLAGIGAGAAVYFFDLFNLFS